MAELFSHNYLPEYKMAQEYYKNKTPIDAVVVRISPHAVYLNLFSEKIQAKLLKDDEEKEQLKVGDRIRVLISHLTGTRIVIKRIISN
jgi:ribosomal protein S1